MLHVYNLPPESTWRDWLREEAPTIKGMILWGVSLWCLSTLAARPGDVGWLLLTPISPAAVVATPMADQAACQAKLGAADQVCVSDSGPSALDTAPLLAP
jgi:hypothetical protein